MTDISKLSVDELRDLGLSRAATLRPSVSEYDR